MSNVWSGMPAGTFDVEDLMDAAESVMRSGEMMDVGLLIDGRRALVDPKLLVKSLSGMSGRVTVRIDGRTLTLSSRASVEGR